MSGKVNMLNISRWTENIGYKTVERFFDKTIDWIQLNWKLINGELSKGDNILIGDTTVVSKSGKKTYGLGRFFSNLQKQTIKSLNFLTVSVGNTAIGKSFPLSTIQVTKEDEKSNKTKNNKNSEPKKRGRPKGSKNKNSSEVELDGIFKVVYESIKTVLDSTKIPDLQYFAFDGAFGNNKGIQAVKRNNLDLISKMARNSALFLKFEGEQKAKGRKRIFGEKIDFWNLDKKYLVETTTKKDIKTEIYQFKALKKTISDMLNIVVIVKTNVKTDKQGYAILFSTDLKLEAKKIMEYYSLRFQIEFNFREAKQFFGLEDFMNIKKNRVNNFANLSFFMQNLSYIYAKENDLNLKSINDLKSHFRALKYIKMTLKFIGKTGDLNLNSELLDKISSFSMINGKSS
jgi:hypothetical protein